MHRKFTKKKKKKIQIIKHNSIQKNGNKVINVDALLSFKNISHVSNCYILYMSNLKIKKKIQLFLEINRK